MPPRRRPDPAEFAALCADLGRSDKGVVTHSTPRRRPDHLRYWRFSDCNLLLLARLPTAPPISFPEGVRVAGAALPPSAAVGCRDVKRTPAAPSAPQTRALHYR